MWYVGLITYCTVVSLNAVLCVLYCYSVNLDVLKPFSPHKYELSVGVFIIELNTMGIRAGYAPV